MPRWVRAQPIASTTPEYWSSPPQILSHPVVAAGCVVLVQMSTLTLPPTFVAILAGSEALAAGAFALKILHMWHGALSTGRLSSSAILSHPMCP